MHGMETHGGALALAPAADPVRPGRAADLVALARPTQWAKNLLVVPIALIDSPQWTVAGLGRIAWAIVAFTLASTLVYVGNDIVDRHRDRLHPVKCDRPVAAGRIPVAWAGLYWLVLATVLGVFVGAWPVEPYWPILAYLLLNILYTRTLKHIPLVDAGTVALGFVLRVVQGYLANGAQPSGWLLVTVLSCCLLLVLGKRREELLVVGVTHRPALSGYSVELLDHLIQLTCVLAAVTGLLYLQSAAPFGHYGPVAMLLSATFALFAIARYLQIVLVQRGGGDPVRILLRDPGMVAVSLLWAIAIGAVLALAHFPAVTSWIPIAVR
jgi:4-hydroxybenzoate polyprenyltransferase